MDSIDYSDHYFRIREHTLFRNLEQNNQFEVIHPYDYTDASHSLTSGTLVGDDYIARTPCIIRTKQQIVEETGESECYGFYYLGTKLCGHRGIIHGGLLATILDEGLCRCGFPLLPSKIGVTAKLDITYLAPVPAGSFIILIAKTTKVEGRKCWVDGEIKVIPDAENYNGESLDDIPSNVKASLLVVEPKWANKLQTFNQ